MTFHNDPNKYVGPGVNLANYVIRNRAPTGADFRQPETGKLYPIFCGWQVGKNPVNGVEGDLWLLTKIVSNVAYWIMVGSGVGPTGSVLTLSDTNGTTVSPNVSGDIELEGTVNQIDITSDSGNNKLTFSLPLGPYMQIKRSPIIDCTIDGLTPIFTTGSAYFAPIGINVIYLACNTPPLNYYKLSIGWNGATYEDLTPITSINDGNVVGINHPRSSFLSGLSISFTGNLIPPNTTVYVRNVDFVGTATVFDMAFDIVGYVYN